ncbi:Nuclease-related domain-containing protein [Alkalibacterium subtropicum]|uniref:Nuclease-related domain-containing protein n=1 Tax=Alkalibacterium subtropicum TaxID=753702 RepID=A0A1I1KG89_9LACT|nr:nuclease-related domain-containing protein [Alkalibacterium subtropicum]SFC59974.1 Nuclease-related domain-containing protein [Alkalibacterium subtropicum]
MIIKERDLSVPLEILLALDRRSNLLNPQTNSIRQMVKGYEGECRFDALLKELTCECLIVNDLTLKISGQTCQIDSLLITGTGVTIYEVKNYEGQFIYTEDKLKILSTNKEISNPVYQLSRTTNLFRQLMEEQHANFQLHSSVVFINERFTLFNAPVNSQYILPTMLPYHLKKLTNERKALNKSHYTFAETLKQMDQTDLSFYSFPEYDWTGLKKGAFCRVCQTALGKPSGRICRCEICGFNELATAVILREISEYRLLFPEKKLTTHDGYDWTGRLFSKKSIRSVLKKNFELKGQSTGCYYE